MRNEKILYELSKFDDEIIFQKIRIDSAKKLLDEISQAQENLIKSYSKIFIEVRENSNKAE